MESWRVRVLVQMTPHTRDQSEACTRHHERGEAGRRAGQISSQRAGETEGGEMSARFTAMVEQVARAKESSGHENGADESE